jgi:hypothetical protein
MGRIVLVGEPSQRPTLFHATPAGQIAGVDIGVHAINSEINGTNYAEVPRYAVVVLDLLIGCLIVLIFGISGRVEWAPTGPCGLLLIEFPAEYRRKNTAPAAAVTTTQQQVGQSRPHSSS